VARAVVVQVALEQMVTATHAPMEVWVGYQQLLVPHITTLVVVVVEITQQ
jgi:hypothetical protein